MFFLIALTFLVTSAHNGTRNYEECLKDDFKHSSCWESKQLYKAGKYGCNLNSKDFSGQSDCN